MSEWDYEWPDADSEQDANDMQGLSIHDEQDWHNYIRRNRDELSWFDRGPHDGCSWRSGDGRWKLSELTQSHLENSIAMLVRREDTMLMSVPRRYATLAWIDALRSEDVRRRAAWLSDDSVAPASRSCTPCEPQLLIITGRCERHTCCTKREP